MSIANVNLSEISKINATFLLVQILSQIEQSVWQRLQPNVFICWFISNIIFNLQACKDFQDLLQKNSLWRHYCRRQSPSLSLNQINKFPSCKDFFRDILKPFSWSLGHTVMIPGKMVGWYSRTVTLGYTAKFGLNAENLAFMFICLMFIT